MDVLDARIEAEPSGGRKAMGRVAGQEDAALAIAYVAK
jgi:hypothetical protein